MPMLIVFARLLIAYYTAIRPCCRSSTSRFGRACMTGVYRQHCPQRLLGRRQVPALLHQDVRERERQRMDLDRRFQNRPRRAVLRPRLVNAPEKDLGLHGDAQNRQRCDNLFNAAPVALGHAQIAEPKKRWLVTGLFLQCEAELRHGVMQPARFLEVDRQLAQANAAAQSPRTEVSGVAAGDQALQAIDGRRSQQAIMAYSLRTIESAGTELRRLARINSTARPARPRPRAPAKRAVDAGATTADAHV